MKRNALFAVVASFVFAYSSIASADTFKVGTPVREPILHAAGCMGLQVAFSPEVVEDLKTKQLDADVDVDCDAKLQFVQTMTHILAGYEWKIDKEGRLLISASTKPTAAAQPQQPAASSTEDENGYGPNSPDPWKRIEWWRSVGNMQSSAQQSAQHVAEYIANAQAQRMFNSYSFDPRYTAGYNGSYGGEFYNYGTLFEHNLVQRAIDLDTWGALKFKKGKEPLMANIEIWGCGQMLAQADEANNIWDQKVLVPVNCRPLTFRYTDVGNVDWEVEIPYMIVPLRLQNAKNITLDLAFFSRARVVTSHQKYSMVEQPDGSFKRVPR